MFLNMTNYEIQVFPWWFDQKLSLCYFALAHQIEKKWELFSNRSFHLLWSTSDQWLYVNTYPSKFQNSNSVYTVFTKEGVLFFTELACVKVLKSYNFILSSKTKYSQLGEQVVISFKICIKGWVKMPKCVDFVHMTYKLKARFITRWTL